MGIELVTCELCGAKFTCVGDSTCWCFRYTPSQPIEGCKGCVCPDCLSAGTNNKETYLMIDIECTGPISAFHNMIEFAVVSVDNDSEVFKASLGGFYGKPWSWEEDTKEWWHHRDRVDLLKAIEREAIDPHVAMRSFSMWIRKFSSPVIVCFGGGDMEFLKYYWWVTFGTTPPFGLLALDAKSYAMAVLNCSFNETKNMGLRRKHPYLFRPDLPHTHRALDDAREQAYMFRLLRSGNYDKKGS